MKVLFLGEIVGKAGLMAVKSLLRPLVKEKGIDLVVANSEGVTSGYGMGIQHAMTLFKYGIDVLTGGEKIFYKIEMQDFINRKDRILRPANYPERAPGRGIKYIEEGDKKVCFINLLGAAAMGTTHLDNPFVLAEYAVGKALEKTPFVFVVFHASATAEKGAMGFHLDGKATAVIGTHCKVMTADEKILKGGTAFITDNGRCGSFMSVGGFEPENEVQKLVLSVFRRSRECFDDIRLQGALVTANDEGRAIEIERIDVPLKASPEAIK